MDNIGQTDTNQNRHTNAIKMLKWTINKTNTANGTISNDSSAAMSIFIDHEPLPNTTIRRSLGAALQPARPKNRDASARKSLGSAVVTRKMLRNQNKENCIMVSPHVNLMRNSPTTSTPLQQKAESAFREIGNLTPLGNSASANTTPLRKAYLPPSPSPKSNTSQESNRSAMRNTAASRPHRLFAATLPTLAVEYSPACNVDRAVAETANSPLSVHGITVQNSIFGNARYFGAGAVGLQPSAKKARLTPEITPLARSLAQLRFSQISLQHCDIEQTEEDDTNMSSKSLDDTALDRMIDEILESTRKVRKCPTRKMPLPPLMLPQCPVTTTSATTVEMAVSIDEHQMSFNSPAERTIINVNGDQEREVRTPDSTCCVVAMSECTPPADMSDDQCQLRRQRVVRRKHTVKGKKTDHNSTPERQCDDKRMEDMLAQMSTPTDETTTATTTTTTSDTPYEIDADDVQGSSPHAEEQLQQSASTRRCLRYPDSPDSMEDSLEKRQSVASSTGSTGSSSSSSTTKSLLFGTLDVSIAVLAHQVHVHVLRCNQLMRTNGAPINAYVKVALLSADQTSDTGFQRTAVHRNSSAPIFEHRFVLDNVAELGAGRVQLSVWHRDREYKRSEFLGCMSFPVQALLANPAVGTYRLLSQSNLTHPTMPILVQSQTPAVASQHDTDTASYLRQSAAAAANGGAAISLSKKALYQREADELLYLRYLKLNAATETEAAGRTQCTLNKRLTTEGSAGFGFSVVWTHPPRVEKVEPNKPAARAGLLPGDFLAFVGEHNVVTMPEVDVLNLIRSQGAQLEIEVFRKPTQTLKRAATTYESTVATFGTQPKHARVEFCAEVGSGIIV